MSDKVLLLGEQCLREKCNEVENIFAKQFCYENNRLKIALESFRQTKGFGRGIAAPQIGIQKRFISLSLGKNTFTIINPVILWHSNETFTLWDDCMSFPDLLIKVKRYSSISLMYQDESGKTQKWEKLEQAASELLQHEIDHLDGILAIDRVIDKTGIIYRSVFEQNINYFEKQVDYIIQKTLN